MSKRDAELVARVQRGMDAYNRGNFDAAMEGVHPDIELVLAGDQQPLKGAAQFRAWMEPDAFGLLIRLEVYLHYQEAEAFEAAGLSE